VGGPGVFGDHRPETPSRRTFYEGGEMATTGTAHGASAGDQHAKIDWVAAERSPEFRELVKKRNAFVVPATIFFLGWYFGFIVLAGYAPDFMGEEFITDGMTVGYALALTQFIMVWGLGWMYLRKADRVFDPLAARAAEVALRAGTEGGRSERPGSGEPARVDEEERR
jgi:uncharacterized membrane protein (DUF485 family)